MLTKEINDYEDIRKTLSHAKLCYEAWWVFTSKRSEREQIKLVCKKYSYFLEISVFKIFLNPTFSKMVSKAFTFER